jgi:hypothetical protein
MKVLSVTANERIALYWLQSRETNMSKVSDAAGAIYDSEEHENESVANSEWWRGELGHAAAVRMVVSLWYLDELGNPTRTVQGT